MPTILGANSVSGYEISNSLRFTGTQSAGAKLSITPGSASNRRTFTYSAWVKKSTITVNADPHPSQTLLFAEAGGNTNNGFAFLPTNTLRFYGQTSSSDNFNLTTTEVFRDTSAWYHVVLASDTTQATASNRMKIYVNGTQITAFGEEDYPDRNLETSVNSAVVHTIGGVSQDFLDGYLTEINFIDGAAKAPSDFGETDDNGVWIPIKYTGSYGTNGYFLEFKQTGTSQNAAGIGADTSGEGNHFAVDTLAAGDVVVDTPNNSFSIMSPVLTDTTTVAFSEGNLKTVCTNASTAGSSIAVDSGKWYVEMICTAKTATNAMIGICTVDGFDGQRQIDESQNGGAGHGYVMNATKLPGGATYGATWAVDDIMGIALDLDSSQNTVTFYKNNASQGTIDIDNKLYVFANSNGQGSSTVTYNTNFGADDTFANEISAAGNTDGRYGKFKYAPPSGYYALCTKRLAEFG